MTVNGIKLPVLPSWLVTILITAATGVMGGIAGFYAFKAEVAEKIGEREREMAVVKSKLQILEETAARDRDAIRNEVARDRNDFHKEAYEFRMLVLTRIDLIRERLDRTNQDVQQLVGKDRQR